MPGDHDFDRTVEFYSEEEEYRSNFYQDEGSVSMAVIETVASVKDVGPAELEALDQSVDPEALETVFEDRGTKSRREGLLRFSYEGFQVDVDYRTSEIRLQTANEETGSS